MSRHFSMLPAPLCEHDAPLTRRAHRAICPKCGSYWDVESRDAAVQYDEAYPETRGHFDPRVGALKVRTLGHWIRAAQLDLTGKTVCEVGFGGGSCLSFLAERAGHVIGVEVNATAIERARSTGVRAELLQVVPLPPLSRPVDVWLFQDSFEHIPDPSAFLDWMGQWSALDAQILMVLPRADSLSGRLMGRYWPHRLPDHEFHWSLRGLGEFLARRGFAIERRFFPLKFASPEMILAHLLHKLGVAESVRRRLSGASFAIPINFGEQGLLLRRRV